MREQVKFLSFSSDVRFDTKTEVDVTYVSAREPWAHQKSALEKMAGREAFALLMAMRTGKTKTLLDDWGALEATGQCQDLLVIAPGGVYRTWETALADHLGPKLAPRVKCLTWKAGAKGLEAQKAQVNFLLDHSGPRVLLVNVEALSFVPRARQLCEEFLDQRRSMLAIDESTTIKSPKAKRTKYIVKNLKPRANYRRILSGLPTPKSPLDLYTQFEFLDPTILGFSTFSGFKARYAIMKPTLINGRIIELIDRFVNVDELHERISPHSFRVQLEDCYDLPPKIYTIREVEMTEEQKRVYNDLKEFATSHLGGEAHVTATVVIAQILRMHQVLCGHVGTEDGHVYEIKENRTQALLDVLEEHGGKGIIWCSYDRDIRKVAAAIAESQGCKVAKFWGGNRNTREEEERMFLTDPECRYIVATAAAGGRGRTWTVADLVVYYSNTADLEHRSQSEERAQGVDKTRSVLYVDLVVPGTVDMKILQTLRRKINLAAAVTGDDWKNWLL